ncbi:MAG: hypothetical protein P8Q99_07985 [Paracoccaceae bacterium]|nr:hypothetical protein [Paracoccaceae bacterium]
MRILFSLMAGGLFGVGLMISGMTDTQKVQGWLDVFGAWDPTLAFVLGGAILPMLLAWQLTKVKTTSLLGTTIPTPADPALDRRLIIGSAIFGFGWAVAGFCPGPALASLSFGGFGGLSFMVAMIAGMYIQPSIKFFGLGSKA